MENKQDTILKLIDRLMNLYKEGKISIHEFAIDLEGYVFMLEGSDNFKSMFIKNWENIEIAYSLMLESERDSMNAHETEIFNEGFEGLKKIMSCNLH